MFVRLAGRAIGFVIRRYVAVLAVALAASAAGTWATLKLPIQSDLAALLPDDDLSVRTLRAIQERVGGFETLQLLVEGEDFAAMETYAATLADRLAAHELVKLVDYRRDTEFFERHALLYVPLDDLARFRDAVDRALARARRARTGLGAGMRAGEAAREARSLLDSLLERAPAASGPAYYVNPAGTVLVLNVYPVGANTDIAFARRFSAAVRNVVAAAPPPAGLTVAYGGNLKNKLDEYEVLIGDVLNTAVIGLSAVLLLVLLYFRRAGAVPLIALPLAMSLSWTFGIAKLVVGELNTMTVFLFIILFGLGIDFGIHFLARYRERRGRGDAPAAAAERAVRTTGRALATTAVTTAAAFYSLMLADFKAFSQFGFIAGTGVLLALAATVTVGPAAILLGERLGLAAGTPAARPRARRRNFSRGVAGAVLMGGAALTVVALIALPRLAFEYDFTNLRSNLPASQAVKDQLSEVFDESNSPAIVLVDDSAQLAGLEAAVRAKQNADPTPTIAHVRTPYTALPGRQDEKLAVLADVRRLLDEANDLRLTAEQRQALDRIRHLATVRRLAPADLPEQVRRVFTDRDGRLGTFAYVYPDVALRDGRNAIRFADDVRAIPLPDGGVLHGANSSVIFADMLLMMRREGGRAVALAFVAIVLLVLLDLRSVRGAVCVLTPLVLGVLWLAGGVALTGMKLNFFNIVAFPTVIGIGVDTGVHLYHRYRQEGPGSLLTVLRYTGGAVAISGLTTMVGFTGLIVARHPGLHSLGLLAVCGIGAVLFAALTVLPAALRWAEPASGESRPA